MSFPRYEKYKDSGVEWLGEVPEHWVVKPLRRLVVSSNAGEVIDRTFWGGSSELLYTCAIQPLDCDYEGFPDWKRTTVDDLLLTRNGTPYVQKPAENAIYTNVVQRITLVHQEDRNFIATALQNSADNLRGYGVSIESLNYEMWKALPVPLPPLPEQRTIAAFLDHETGKIDALVAEQEKLIGLLKEKRQAVISHAVTKGLDPNARMKDSGVEWLGEVPEGWKVVMIRRCLIEHRQGYYSSNPYSESGVKLLRITDLRDHGSVSFDDCPFVEHEEGISPFLLQQGDFVFARTGGAGSFGVIGEIKELVAYASYLIRFRFDTSSVTTEFLRFFFHSDCFQKAIKQNIHGGVNQNVHAEDIKDQYIAIPSESEQLNIASFLITETAKFDTLIEEAQKAIELMKERRTALISAAVTGKIDVRGRV